MFLRTIERYKNGKKRRYWSVVENRRVAAKRVVQKTLLYLGEINDSQQSEWIHAIEMIEDDKKYQFALFTEDRQPPAECDSIQVKMSHLKLSHPRQWGACWLAMELWDQLKLDEFWGERLKSSREGTNWLNILKTMVSYRLIDPGSEVLYLVGTPKGRLSKLEEHLMEIPWKEVRPKVTVKLLPQEGEL